MKAELTSWQMHVLVMFWVGIPALTALPFAAQNGIINVIIGGLAVIAETLVICRTKLNESAEKILMYTAAVSLVFTASVNISFLTKTVVLYLLPHTNPVIISVVFTAAVLYMAVSGTKTLGRTAEIFFAVVFLNVTGAIFTGMGSAEFVIGHIVISDIFKAACAFGGVQILYFILPRTKGENVESKAVVSVVTAVVTAVIFVMISMGKFGTADMSERNFSIYNIMDSVHIPALFGDKHDLFMLRTGIFGSFIAVGEGLVFAGNVFTEKKYFKPVMALIIFIISLFAEKELLWFTGIISIIIFGIVMPITAGRVKK